MKYNSYNSKTLVGNWFEERCNPGDKMNTFNPERKDTTTVYKPLLQKEAFMNTDKDWLKTHGQPEEIISQTKFEYKNPKEQVRHSELNKFVTKKGVFEKNPDQLEEYRNKYTKSQHIFPRTYAGSQNGSS